MADNLQVAVRVRPFNDREIAMNSECCIKMLQDTQQTVITDPTNGQDRSFTFDYSYNSFIDPSHPEFASQDVVWDNLGVKVLEHAWNGYNCSLFAYGQTGSGKSYSMVGYGPDKGIIPRASQVIFQRIGENTSDISYKVEASMLEIYNERVKDLFNPSSDNLKVRDHPKKGPYAEGLTHSAVSSIEEINNLMESGIMARTTAATSMNATSSRAHTIFQIRLTQSEMDPSSKKMMDKVSRVSLIDLAGSERAASTGATGGRLKEGAAINQSLSALGNVISALADNANGKKMLVPYRNSKLTHLLKDSLGGNSKTIMIAALSPASVNFGETLGTLRYADRAKQIKNKAVVNEDPNQKLIRQLKEELMSLRKSMVESGSSYDLKEGIDRRHSVMDADQEKELAIIREKLEENQRLLEESQKTWQEKLLETVQMAKLREERLQSIGLVTNFSHVKERATKEAHILNLNEDPMMSEKLFYFLNSGINAIGREDAETPQDIVLGGLGILKSHCTINCSPTSIVIQALPTAKIFVNGVKMSFGLDDTITLSHCDRLMMGNSNLFRICIPSLRDIKDVDWSINESKLDWQYARKELNSKQMNMSTNKMDSNEEAEAERREMEDRIEHMQSRMKIEQKAAEERIALQKIEWEKNVEQLREDMKLKEKELSKPSGDDTASIATALAEQEVKLAQALAKADLEYEERQRLMLAKQNELEMNLLQQVKETKMLAVRKAREREERDGIDSELLRHLPLINEANAISEELEKDCGFILRMHCSKPSLKILSDQSCDAMAIMEGISSELLVQVNLTEVDGTVRSVTWSLDKFNERLMLMQHMYQTYLEQERNLEAVRWEATEDPFCDVIEAQLIGRSYLYMELLLYGIPLSVTTPIYDIRGKLCGTLKCHIKIIVSDPRWDTSKTFMNSNNETTIENIALLNLNDFIGKEGNISLYIPSLQNVPSKLCKDVFVALQWMQDPMCISAVSVATSVHPVLEYRLSFPFTVSHELVQYLSSFPLEIQVYGMTPTTVISSSTEVKRASIGVLPPIEEIRKGKKSDKKHHKIRRSKSTKSVDDFTLLTKTVVDQKETISIQENALMENTQELEHSLYDIGVLKDQLEKASFASKGLIEQVMSLSRQNDILKEKIKTNWMGNIPDHPIAKDEKKPKIVTKSSTKNIAKKSPSKNKLITSEKTISIKNTTKSPTSSNSRAHDEAIITNNIPQLKIPKKKGGCIVS